MTPKPEDEKDLRAAGWRKMNPAAEIAFFVVTLFAVSFLYGFCKLLSLPAGWICLIASLGIAELLIRNLKFWRTGVESALWIGGLCAFIFSLPSSGKPEAVLVFVAAFAIAGFRLRNPLFSTIAVSLVIAYLAAKEWNEIALVAALALAILAAALTVRAWRRPSNALLFSALAIFLPIVGFIAYAIGHWSSDAGIVMLFVAVAIVELAIGIYFRVRAPMIAAVFCLAIAVIAAHDFIPFTVEMQMIVGGILALVTAAALMRAMRAKTSGIVVTETKEPELREAMQIAAMLPAGVPQTSPDTGVQTGGGEFGGAGASGNF